MAGAAGDEQRHPESYPVGYVGGIDRGVIHAIIYRRRLDGRAVHRIAEGPVEPMVWVYEPGHFRVGKGFLI